MNAIEYGSQNDPTIPVEIVVEPTATDLVVRITDRGRQRPDPGDAEEPDLEKKLAGEQKPRGWGLFLIKHMVDAMEVTSDGHGPDRDPDDAPGEEPMRCTESRSGLRSEAPDGARGVELQRRHRTSRPRRDLATAYAAGDRPRPARRPPRLQPTSTTSTAPGSPSIVRLLADARRDGRDGPGDRAERTTPRSSGSPGYPTTCRSRRQETPHDRPPCIEHDQRAARRRRPRASHRAT